MASHPRWSKFSKSALLEPLHELLSLMEGRRRPTTHAWRHHHHDLLQQLWSAQTATASIVFWYLSHEDVGEVFARPLLARLQVPRLLWVPMRFAGWEIHHRRDFHCAPATGKFARTGLAALYLVSIDLAKAFDLMGRKVLFQLLRKIGCHPKHLVSYHESMRGTVSCDGFTSDPFPIKNGVKRGCSI